MTATVLVAPVPADVDAAKTLLRELVATAAATRAADPDVRTWAILGQLTVAADISENDGVVEHDRVGRQAVRLAVDKTLCVGDSRSVRALHQGAVMEGSWGDEVRQVGTAAEARELLTSDVAWRPGPGDVILVAGSDAGVAELAGIWRQENPA
ncbi:UDP-N-acetylmuramoyl-tripeptide--D-alanyl-D-alanine ligase [Gordonia sp. PKS22-38]|uniref:UDP-N-acetylmuramoyl-tripeptide--D-alanyl-D-alanine ligase n=1 Tax=Gordonia prachuapensis TaxID=3115651 RepID=A0ABU7MS86_9ACTN|nr:UDP-N-acetylmuramoyl-tripeptide--D-alanyl-D-alanine ligase [Gordonia sp. PKS22-38]